MSENRTRGFNKSVREEHLNKFTFEPQSGASVIYYENQPLVMITDCGGLPPGFYERLTNHIAELISGTRTALWDDQAIFGSKVKPTREELTALRDHFNSAQKDD